MSDIEVVNNERILKVASGTEVIRLSTAITSCYDKDPKAPIIVRAIGAGALNQAIKSIITSGQYFSQKGLRVMTTQSFKTLEEDGRKTTAIELNLHFSRM